MRNTSDAQEDKPRVLCPSSRRGDRTASTWRLLLLRDQAHLHLLLPPPSYPDRLPSRQAERPRQRNAKGLDPNGAARPAGQAWERRWASEPSLLPGRPPSSKEADESLSMRVPPDQTPGCTWKEINSKVRPSPWVLPSWEAAGKEVRPVCSSDPEAQCPWRPGVREGAQRSSLAPRSQPPPREPHTYRIPRCPARCVPGQTVPPPGPLALQTTPYPLSCPSEPQGLCTPQPPLPVQPGPRCTPQMSPLSPCRQPLLSPSLVSRCPFPADTPPGPPTLE